jgi:protein associated with RNAse G/E
MGMSLIEHYLSIKHFPHDELKLINSSPILIKQKLKELATDLIKIIYLNENILLSYDLEEMKKIKSEMK